jgi:hypothetical protein
MGLGTPPIAQHNHPTWVAASELINFNVPPHPSRSIPNIVDMRIDQLRSQSAKDGMRVNAIEIKSNSLHPA